jgi:hypothetical protein
MVRLGYGPETSNQVEMFLVCSNGIDSECANLSIDGADFNGRQVRS